MFLKCTSAWVETNSNIKNNSMKISTTFSWRSFSLYLLSQVCALLLLTHYKAVTDNLQHLVLLEDPVKCDHKDTTCSMCGSNNGWYEAFSNFNP